MARIAQEKTNPMQSGLEQLAAADTDHAVEIANRIWWVGHLLEDEVFQCHTYLLEQGDESVLFDPGSPLTFPETLRKIQEVLPFAAVKYFVCHHQDPDITAALPMIDTLVERPDAKVVTHTRTQELLKHYGVSLPFRLIDAHDWRLPLKDRELQFIFTPYAHFPTASREPSSRATSSAASARRRLWSPGTRPISRPSGPSTSTIFRDGTSSTTP